MNFHAHARYSAGHLPIRGARDFLVFAPNSFGKGGDLAVLAHVTRAGRGKICYVPTSSITAQRFRRMALALDGAVEGAHMGHPDFRVDKRIFASLHTGNQFGMVKLTPDQQALFIEDHPEAFVPEAGAWGRSGCTRVILKAADEEAVGEALTLAWQNTRKVLRKKCR